MVVDWTAQWELHAPNFANGYAHIDLSRYGMEGMLRLQPGGGFGDTSHPTTRLVLRMMGARVRGRTLIDIGCGSGILSLAGLIAGAKSAIGLDIEEEALQHARANAILNQLSYFQTSLPPLIVEPLIVMNMISSEQRVAWKSHPSLHTLECPIITSGILASEREEYLDDVRYRGWHLLEEMHEDEWVAFLFQQGVQYSA